VDPLEPPVGQSFDLWLCALSRRDHGRRAPRAGPPSGQSWSEGDWH
jgi:hypothetical protein